MSFSEELKANETLRMEPFLLSKLIFILNNNIIIKIKKIKKKLKWAGSAKPKWVVGLLGRADGLGSIWNMPFSVRPLKNMGQNELAYRA